MQLHPKEKFIITRQLQNPYITDTFYVRAVIRNSRTDTVIATLDLDDQGGQRFTKEWMTPNDPSGLGFYVSIVTSVYSDSGYTTKDQNYGDEENTYLIQDRYIFNPNYPVGADIDYKRIRKIITEEVNKAVNDIKIPNIPKVITVTKEVVVEKLIPQEKFPEIKFPSNQPILDAIKTVGQKVDDKPVTEIPKIEFGQVLSAISKLATITTAQKDELASLIKETLDKNTSRFNKIQQMKKIFDEMMPEESFEVVSTRSKDKKPEMDPRITRLMQTK